MNRKLKLLVAVVVSGALIAGAADAASSPTVTTGSATSINTSSALLHGTVNPNGAQTSYHFEWGLSTAYGSTSPAKTAKGTKKISVKASAAHLLPGTVYHYHLVASNRFGSSAGTDHTFKTAGNAPPTAATGGSANVGTTSALVAGVINPHGARTFYVFQFGLSSSYSYQTITQSVPAGSKAVIVTQSLTGLAPGSTFHYRIVAFHGSTVVATGNDLTFITKPSPRPVPRVTANNKPSRDSKKPYVFTTSGKVVGSSRFPASSNCTGNVTVKFVLGKRTVASHTVPLGSDCTYSVKTTFRHKPGSGKRPTHEKLQVHVKFAGNDWVAPGSSRTGTVTLG